MVTALAGPASLPLSVLRLSLWFHYLSNESVLPSEMTPFIETVKSAVAWPQPTVPWLPVTLPLSLCHACHCHHTGHYAPASLLYAL